MVCVTHRLSPGVRMTLILLRYNGPRRSLIVTIGFSICRIAVAFVRISMANGPSTRICSFIRRNPRGKVWYIRSFGSFFFAAVITKLASRIARHNQRTNFSSSGTPAQSHFSGSVRMHSQHVTICHHFCLFRHVQKSLPYTASIAAS